MQYIEYHVPYVMHHMWAVLLQTRIQEHIHMPKTFRFLLQCHITGQQTCLWWRLETGASDSKGPKNIKNGYIICKWSELQLGHNFAVLYIGLMLYMLLYIIVRGVDVIVLIQHVLTEQNDLEEEELVQLEARWLVTSAMHCLE